MTIDDYLKRLRRKDAVYGRNETEHRMIRRLANEVVRLRNEMPCPECLGTPGRMCTGEVYMGGPETYDKCDKCSKHPGKQFKPQKEI